MRKTMETVMEMGKINLRGNMYSMNWFKHLKTNAGLTDLIGVVLLSDIFYWYQPTEVRDESTGKVVGYRKKFKADKLQRSYSQFSEMFGLTKNQVRDALKRLENAGLITIEFRHVTTKVGTKVANVMFVEAVPERIAEITYGTECHNECHDEGNDECHASEISEGVVGNFLTRHQKKPDTNTETTTKTTTETTTYKELSTPKGTLDPIKKEKDYLFPSVKTEGIACENFSFPEEEYMFFDQYLKFYGGTKYFTPNAIEATKYFTNTYRRVFKKLHPRDTKEGWEEILTGVLKIPLKSDTGEIYISENLFDFFELKEIIDLFFQQKFREPCNYSIRFFMQPGVKYRLFQKWQKEEN